MPQPGAVPASPDEQLDDEYLAGAIDSDFSVLEIFRDQALEAHEQRCERIAHNVMTRIAEMPVPSASQSFEIPFPART
jgi:hypothetical protein